MRLALLGFACYACVLGSAAAAEKRAPDAVVPDLPPGKETRVESPRVGGGFFLVYVPSDYKPDRRWPVVVCYHGQNGQPTVWPIKDVTGGKGFIIFGMGYFPEHSKAMTIPELDRYCAREVDGALAALATVESRLKMDKEQVIVSGFSMGGWFAGMFGEISPSTWAGVAILGAGRRKFDAPLRPAGILRRKPIYIGAGDKDPNFPSAQNGAEFYRKAGATVTFEKYDGLGHQMKTDSQVFRDWLWATGPLRTIRPRLNAAKAAEQAGKLGKAYTLYDQASKASDTDELCAAAAKSAQAIEEQAEKQLAEAEKAAADKRDDAPRLLALLASRYEGSPFGERADALLHKLQLQAKANPPAAKEEPAATPGKAAAPPSSAAQGDRECASWLSLADNYLRNGKPDLAREYLRRIIEKHPDSDWAAKARERLATIK